MRPEDALKLGLDEVLAESRGLSLAKLGDEVVFYTPSFLPSSPSGRMTPPASFISVSVTGYACALQCDHCRGRLLRGMTPATTPDKLREVCRRVKESGGVGLLISGGSDVKGKVPLKPFLDVIYWAKKTLGLTVVVHTGLLSEEVAKGLAEAGVDAALLDVIGSEDTARRVYHLDVKLSDFERALALLERYRVPTVPHVLVGLHYGELKGELEALKMIARHNPAAIVVIALIPLPGTSMEHVAPPPPEQVARIVAAARFIAPGVPIALGCARPKGRHRSESDVLALRAGVNAIAFPSQEGVEEARKLRLKYSFRPTCCSQVYVDLKRESS
ncbi:MAG: radical SAM protein [Thermoprotei archaeon]|nr:MAG: radical SAM protein [Thermoprotei archaeon]